MDTVPDFKSGHKLPSGDALQALANNVRELDRRRPAWFGHPEPEWYAVNTFPVVVLANGGTDRYGNVIPDYTDEHYYAQRCDTSVNADDGITLTFAKLKASIPDFDLTDHYDSSQPLRLKSVDDILTFTNLSEESSHTHTLASGVHVLVTEIVDRATGAHAYVRDATDISGLLIRVDLAQTAGAGGPPPTWVYTVTDLDGNQLGTGMSPEWRLPFRADAATSGYGYYTPGGAFVLAEAKEPLTTTACP